MAKVMNPLQSSEARGRVGGLVYNTWRGIRTVKSHTAPGHQSDPLRQAHKLKVQTTAARWRTLSDDQRADWNHYADEHPQIDWTGRPVRIAGFHWYVRTQVALLDIDLTYTDTPPLKQERDIIHRLVVVPYLDYISLTWTKPLGVEQGMSIAQVWRTAAHSPGRTMTIRDARWQSNWPYDYADADDKPPATGYYTYFVRAVSIEGLAGPWAKAVAYYVA
jgi:hypothetical protein